MEKQRKKSREWRKKDIDQAAESKEQKAYNNDKKTQLSESEQSHEII